MPVSSFHFNQLVKRSGAVDLITVRNRSLLYNRHARARKLPLQTLSEAHNDPMNAAAPSPRSAPPSFTFTDSIDAGGVTPAAVPDWRT